MAAWEASYNVKNNTGDWEAFHDTFSTARGSLNNMQEITEAWAESEHKALVLEIRIKIIVISLIFAALIFLSCINIFLFQKFGAVQIAIIALYVFFSPKYNGKSASSNNYI